SFYGKKVSSKTWWGIPRNLVKKNISALSSYFFTTAAQSIIPAIKSVFLWERSFPAAAKKRGVLSLSKPGYRFFSADIEHYTNSN
ncbi:MAG: hypothetical protein KKD66_08860, partial [Proteobacteria bacterium]|nr:hypothetical protein [Pseudomonadota bacterium]